MTTNTPRYIRLMLPSCRVPSPGPRGPSLLGPIADVSAGGACALSIVARATDFGAGAAGDPLGDIARARVFGVIVAGAASHRLFGFARILGKIGRAHV